jgi:hypothetical protein
MTIATDKRLTELQLKAKLNAEEIKEKEKARLTRAFRECFASESGMIVLKWIMTQCCYQISEVSANPATGEINEKASLYNAIRRTLYIRIRKFLHRDILTQVEMDSEGGLVGSAEDLLT